MSKRDHTDSVSTIPTKSILFNPLIFLSIIVVFSLLLRLCYFPHNIPFGLDALSYFSYAVKTSQLGHLPTDQNLPNNGWSAFLSIFFYFFHSVDFLDYMELQRYISISISLATIIPVYLLCRRFFAVPYSLLGAALFAFEPKIITNSFLGITEPAYVFLGTLTLVLFLGKSYKFVYVSFATSALFTLVRYEGLFLIVPLSIMFFVRFRNERKFFLRYLLALSIFILVLLPMVYFRIQASGEDGLTSHLFAGSTYVSEQIINGVPDDDYPIIVDGEQNKTFHFIFRGFSTLVKYLSFLAVPNFIIFIGLGLYFYIKDKKYKNLDYRTITILVFAVFQLLPAFYAYMRGIQEIRYLIIILPIFYLLSSFTFKKFGKQFRRFSVIAAVVLVGIFFASLSFLESQRIDYEHEREAFIISEHIVKTPKRINEDPIDGNYITTAQVIKNWPRISSLTEFDVDRISTSGFNSLEEFIGKSKHSGLTHIIADGSLTRPAFLKDVFDHEDNYPYLIKVYDSTEYNMKYHVKMYKIDYDIFDRLVNGEYRND